MKNKHLNKALGFMLFAGMTFSFHVKAQVDPTINAKPADLRMMEKRTLIVELLETNPKFAATFTKKHKTEALKQYNDFVKTYNTDIKTAISKYWTLNKNVEYKTETEVKEMPDSKDYVILSFQISLSDGTGKNMYLDDASYGIPILTLERPELNNERHAPDEQIYFPPLSIPDKFEDPRCCHFGQSSFDFSVREMQANIEYMLQTDKQCIFKKYALAMSENNKCEKLKKTDLLLQVNRKESNLTNQEISQFYTGKYEFVPDADFDNALANETDGKAVLLMVPYGLISMGGGFMSVTSLAYMRIAVDCKTGDILYADAPHSGHVDDMIRKQTFKALGKCK